MKVKQLFRHKWWAGLAVSLIMVAARSAHACATCGLGADDPKSYAYRSSVLFMMAAPYSIFLIGSVVAFFAYRAACRRRTEAEDRSPANPPFANR